MMEIDILAHEIINPLNIIVGCAELSAIEANQLKNDKITNYLKTIVSQSIKCCSMLEQQIQQCDNSIYCELDFACFIKRIISTLKNHPLLNGRNIVFTLNDKTNQNHLQKIKIKNENKCYLKIIVNNMIMNAIKHSNEKEDIFISFKNRLAGNSQTVLEIKNKINYKEKESHFTKSNFLGLNIIDSLVKKIEGDWNLIQDNDDIITNLILF
jgi:two-component sensor histidine kinase